jgi:hypothetical protein
MNGAIVPQQQWLRVDTHHHLNLGVKHLSGRKCMRIGMFTAAQWSPEENPEAVLRALREQVRVARDCGFSSCLWVSTC